MVHEAGLVQLQLCEGATDAQCHHAPHTTAEAQEQGKGQADERGSCARFPGTSCRS
jgi:hypothetical protein